MISKVAIILSSLINRHTGRYIFVNNYSGHLNVGDLLHEEIIKFYCNKKTIKIPSVERFQHYLMVGSIVDKMNSKSTVIGSGVNSEKNVNMLTEIGTILALRGHKTRALLENKFKCELDVPLGDLGILYPDVYFPVIEVKHQYGLILHYVDEEHSIRDIAIANGVKIISVRQEPKQFIKELLSCEYIISSSMHGCILSDSYGIKNKRITLSDKITGANLKFADYYSTTNNPSEAALFIKEDPEWGDIKKAYNLCSVKEYIYSKDQLRKILLEIK